MSDPVLISLITSAASVAIATVGAFFSYRAAVHAKRAANLSLLGTSDELGRFAHWVRSGDYNMEDSRDEIARAMENRVRQLKGQVKWKED